MTETVKRSHYKSGTHDYRAQPARERLLLARIQNISTEGDLIQEFGTVGGTEQHNRNDHGSYPLSTADSQDSGLYAGVVVQVRGCISRTACSSPPRFGDHSIQLEGGKEPTNIRPYSYPYKQDRDRTQRERNAFGLDHPLQHQFFFLTHYLSEGWFVEILC